MGFELIRDFERGTVTLAFDDVEEFEWDEGPLQDRATVVLSRTEYEAHVRPAVVHTGRQRGAAPLNWSTRDGITPSGVRTALPASLFSKASVVAMLDAADEAHRVRLYEENAEGGKAREEASKLRGELEAAQSDRSRWESLATSRRADVERLTAELSQAKEQRYAWKEAMEAMDAKHVQPLRRELAELKAAHEAATVPKLGWPFVVHTTAADRDWTSDDHVTARLWEEIAASAPVGSLVDDLKNVIVSQAREIARLKGESE